MNNLEKYSLYINNIWKQYITRFCKNDTHLFLLQNETINKINKDSSENDIKQLKKIMKMKKFSFLQTKYKKISYNYENIFSECIIRKINNKIILDKYIYDVYYYILNNPKLNIDILQKKWINLIHYY